MPRLVSRLYKTASRLGTGHIVLITLVLCLIWLALCPNQPVSDQATYHTAAHQLADGSGYIEINGSPANLRPVGYPALLGATYWLFGSSYTIGYLLNIVLLLLLVLGAQQLGAALFNREVGLLAALLVAIHPTLVMHTTMLTSEVPFAVGALWLGTLLVRMARGEVPLSWSVPLAGASLGLLCYVRPTGQLFCVLLPLLGLFWRRIPLVKLALASAGVALIALLVLLPWGLRNQALFGEMSLTSNNGGENLWMGNNPASDGEYMSLPPDVRDLPLVQREHVLAERASAFIREDPARYVRLCANRIMYTLRSDTIGAVWNATGITRRFGEHAIVFFKVVCSVFHWLLLSLVVYALITRKRKSWTMSDASLGALFVLLSLPFVLIVGGNRYMVPIIPLFCIVAASGLWQRFGSVPASAQRNSAPSAPAP